MKNAQIHQILGISDDLEKEIANKVVTTLTDAGRVDMGIKKLMETYPAEAMLVGMRLMQAINLNKTILAEQQANAPRKQNAHLN